MAIRSSGYFNNPQFAQAASNLSALFAPPSGADASGWATANAKKEEAARLAQFYDYATAPDFDQQQFDRMGVGAGVYTPNQSYHAVELGDATTRRGQDVTASTSRANNADDNVRALEVGKLDNLADLFGPLNQGQLRPELPAEIAGRFGVESALPAVHGNEKPLTDDELKAQILAGMDPSLQEAAAFGTTPVEQIVTPEGPRFETRLDAIGQEPVINKGATAAPQTENYVTPTGQGGTAFYDGTTNQWLDTNSKAPIPPGSRTYTGQLSGDAAGTGFGATTANNTEATKREAAISQGLARVQDYRKLLVENPAIAGVPGMLRGFSQDVVSFAQEMSGAYGEDSLVFTSPEEVQAFAEKLGARGNYDPAIKAAQAMALEMAYLEAKALDPGGEVNVREMERFLDKWNGGLGGNQSVLASLAELERSLQTQLRTNVDTLRNPGQTPPPPVEGGAVEKWERGPNGLVRVQ